MRLQSVRVQNFKSIEDSGEFTVDQVTCLVGKNEAGKTAILEALEKLNPIPGKEADFDEEEYPRRHLSTYRERKDRHAANVLTTRWELEDQDVQALEEVLGEGCLSGRIVTITKGYNNTRGWNIPLDEAHIAAQFIDKAHFNAVERTQIGSAGTIEALIAALARLDSPTRKHTLLANRLKAVFPSNTAVKAAVSILVDRLPRFVSFASYHHLPGRVALDDLKRRKASGKLRFPDRIFLALLAMTSTGLDEIEGMRELEKLIMELEAVEARLTDEIKEYWSQNRHLEVRFRYDSAREGDLPPFNEGFIFNTRIYNTRHRATVNFEERSHGFIWFFSFLVWFSQVKREYGEEVILLLDEPGLPLHGRAQEDLLRYINQRLRPHYQVIYTAHSPFMIDVNNIFSLRTVEDVVIKRTDKDGRELEEIHGTKVGERILSRDKDTLFPLQGILGFNVAQTLFVGPFVLVVEGPTERAVIDWFSKQLIARGREGLDIRWAVCPAEGAPKISSFVTLFAGRGLKIAVLADYHQGQRRIIDNLEASGLLEDGHLFRTSTFTENDESDIEDLIGRELYIHLVNESMKLPEQYRLPDERPDDASIRVVKEVEAHSRVLPLGYPEFNHYKPIQYLLAISSAEAAVLPGLESALDRFEELFQALNNLIPSKVAAM